MAADGVGVKADCLGDLLDPDDVVGGLDELQDGRSRVASRGEVGPGRGPRTEPIRAKARPTECSGIDVALTGHVYHINTGMGINPGSMFDVVIKGCSVRLVTT